MFAGQKRMLEIRSALKAMKAPVDSAVIYGLKTELNQLEAIFKEVPMEIIVEMEGGLINGVYTNSPVDLYIVDFDTDGADKEDLFKVQAENGDILQAYVRMEGGVPPVPEGIMEAFVREFKKANS